MNAVDSRKPVARMKNPLCRLFFQWHDYSLLLWLANFVLATFFSQAFNNIIFPSFSFIGVALLGVVALGLMQWCFRFSVPQLPQKALEGSIQRVLLIFLIWTSACLSSSLGAYNALLGTGFMILAIVGLLSANAFFKKDALLKQGTFVQSVVYFADSPRVRGPLMPLLERLAMVFFIWFSACVGTSMLDLTVLAKPQATPVKVLRKKVYAGKFRDYVLTISGWNGAAKPIQIYVGKDLYSQVEQNASFIMETRKGISGLERVERFRPASE